MIKIVYIDFILRRPFSKCIFPNCYKGAVIIFKDRLIEHKEYSVCEEHVDELLRKFSTSESEILLEAYIYINVKLTQDKISILKNICPRIKYFIT